MAVGGKVSGSGVLHFALAGDKNLDVVIGLVLVNFVEDDLARPHTVSAFGVIGAAFHDAFVFPALDQLLGVVIVLVQLAFPLGAFQHFQKILYRAGGLFFVVGANVHIVSGAFAVRGNAAGAVVGDQPVLAGTAGHHAEHRVPSGHPLGGIGAVPQADQKLLPGEEVKGEVFLQPHVLFQLAEIHRQVFGFKAFADVGHQCVLLGTGSGAVRFYQLDVFQDFRWDLTAHRPDHRPWARLN